MKTSVMRSCAPGSGGDPIASRTAEVRAGGLVRLEVDELSPLGLREAASGHPAEFVLQHLDVVRPDRSVEERDRPVFASGHERAAVRGESDRVHPIALARHGSAYTLPGLHIEELDLSRLRAGGE